MKTSHKSYLTHLLIFCCLSIITFNSCKSGDSRNQELKDQDNSNNLLIVGVSADYPPFEFIENGEFKGLDIDLANLIGKHLNKKIEFKDLNYSYLFPALNAGQIDMAISTITFTNERSKNFDLSNPYYFADIAVIFNQDRLINKIADLNNKKVGVQFGSTMEMWAKALKEKISLISMDVTLQLIEALKSKQLDVVVLEEAQAKEFCKKNSKLGYLVVAKANNGYVVALKHGSKLLTEINRALSIIKEQGDFNKLNNKWLEILFEMEVHDAS